MIIVVSGKRLNSHSFLIKVFASLILFLSISNSQCSAFDIRCITCTLTQCTQCQNGYVVNALMTTCIECNVPNCLSCVNPNSCSSCIGNFSVNIFGGSCTLCRVPNCLNCNNINTCNQCEPGFIAKQDGTCSSNCTTANNLCLGCSSLNFCSDCPANAMLNGTNTPVTLFQGNCYFCSDPQCLICSSDQVCQNCNGTHLAISQSGNCIAISSESQGSKSNSLAIGLGVGAGVIVLGVLIVILIKYKSSTVVSNENIANVSAIKITELEQLGQQIDFIKYDPKKKQRLENDSI